VDRVHGAVDRGQRRSTVDLGQRAWWRLTGARRADAGARQCLLVTEGGGQADRGGAREMLTGDEGVAMRRRTGGSERWWLELIARAKEGTK
jgi:hypothetical protein